MKKEIIFMSLTGLVLSGCNESTNEDSSNELQSIELSNEQTVSFNHYIDSINNTVSLINDLDFESDSTGQLAEVLISVQDIEDAYLEAGGNQQSKIIDYLQNSSLGFYGIANNMVENSRDYTLTESHGSIKNLMSYTTEIIETYNLSKDNFDLVEDYFIDELNFEGTYEKALKEYLIANQ